MTTLLSHVNSYRTEYDDGYLPPHLCLHGLATSIHETTQGWLRDVISPRVRRVLEDDDIHDGRNFLHSLTRVQGVPRVNRMAVMAGRIRTITIAGVVAEIIAAATRPMRPTDTTHRLQVALPLGGVFPGDPADWPAQTVIDVPSCLTSSAPRANASDMSPNAVTCLLWPSSWRGT